MKYREINLLTTQWTLPWRHSCKYCTTQTYPGFQGKLGVTRTHKSPNKIKYHEVNPLPTHSAFLDRLLYTNMADAKLVWRRRRRWRSGHGNHPYTKKKKLPLEVLQSVKSSSKTWRNFSTILRWQNRSCILRELESASGALCRLQVNNKTLTKSATSLYMAASTWLQFKSRRWVSLVLTSLLVVIWRPHKNWRVNNEQHSLKECYARWSSYTDTQIVMIHNTVSSKEKKGLNAGTHFFHKLEEGKGEEVWEKEGEGLEWEGSYGIRWKRKGKMKVQSGGGKGKGRLG